MQASTENGGTIAVEWMSGTSNTRAFWGDGYVNLDQKKDQWKNNTSAALTVNGESNGVIFTTQAAVVANGAGVSANVLFSQDQANMTSTMAVPGTGDDVSGDLN